MRPVFAFTSLTALLLSACGPAEDPSSVPPAVLGPRVFTARCVVCHGATGQGLAGLYPPLARSEVVQGDPQHLVRILLHGLQGPVEVNGQVFNNQLPPWDTLHDAEIAAVLTFIRGQWGNQGGPVTEAQVARLRAHYAKRGQPWSMDQLRYEKPVEWK